jgi:hypothetical protein
MDKLVEVAPGRLSMLLVQGLRGHHPLFEADAIRQAFDAPDADAPVDREDADEVGQALLAMCRESPAAARGAVETLTPRARTSLIRLYFRLLDRAHTEKRRAAPTH